MAQYTNDVQILTNKFDFQMVNHFKTGLVKVQFSSVRVSDLDCILTVIASLFNTHQTKNTKGVR